MFKFIVSVVSLIALLLIIFFLVLKLTSKEGYTIKVKYMSDDYPKLKKIPKGDWVDLRVDDVKFYSGNLEEEEKFQKEFLSFKKDGKLEYKTGDVLFLGLGVAMELPKGHEAILAPRSSTFKNKGFLLTNSIGVIDSSFCGDKDEWGAMVIATRDGIIERHDRLFQFRIQKNQPNINIEEVDSLENQNRGGYGTTGLK